MAKRLKNPPVTQGGQPTDGQNIINGTGKGFVQGGAYGAIAGFVNSALENHAQMAADRRSRRFQAEQAEKQFNRQRYFDNLEKRWNSEQAQVQRFKDAGLNPNLMYGDLSSSTASTPSVPMASTPNGVTRDFSIDSSSLQGAATGIDEILKAANVDNLNQNTANQFQDTVGKDIENRYKETGIIQTLTEQIERINKLRVDIEKTGADTKTVDALRDNLVEQLNQEIELLKQKQNDSIQNRKESEQRITESKQNVTKSKQDVKESKQRVTESNQRIEESKQNINESKSRESLNKAVEKLRDVETKDLLLKYHVDNDQYSMINDYVHKHNLPPGSEKVIIQALENFAQSLGKKVPEVTLDVVGSWLNADTWLNYMAQEHRTEAIKQGNNESVDGTFTPPSHNYQTTPEQSLNPNAPPYERNYDKRYSPEQKRFIDTARVRFKYLDEQHRKEYQSWLETSPYSTQYERAQKIHTLLHQQYQDKRPWNEK